MKRLAISACVAMCLFTPGWVSAQTPDIIFGNQTFREHRKLTTLSSLIAGFDTIAVWRVGKSDDKQEHVRFETVEILKGDRPAGLVPPNLGLIRDARFELNWEQPGRLVVAFIKDEDAAVCFGPYWRIVRHTKGSWWNDHWQSGLEAFYTGPVDRLIGHVRAILAGRQVVVTAAKMRSPWSRDDVQELDEPHRIWRLKASLKITTDAQTIRAPNYVGWGAGEAKDVPEMVRRLRHPDPCVRWLAVAELESLGPAAKPALAELWKLFADREPRLRVRAVEAALNIDPADPLPTFVIAFELHNKSAVVRRTAVLALGRHPERAAAFLPQLLASFDLERPAGGRDTLDLLARFGPRAIPEFKRQMARVLARKIRLSVKADDAFQARAIPILASLGADAEPAFPTLRAVVRASPVGVDEAAVTIARYMPDGPLWLAELLRRDSAPKLAIAQALAQVGRADLAVPEVRKLLNDENPWERCYAALTLGEIDPAGRGEAVTILLKLAAEEKAVREYIRIGLAHRRWLEPRFTNAEGWRYERYLLMKHVRDSESPERNRALSQLAGHGAAAADVAPEIWRLLKRADPKDRAEFIIALWQIDGLTESGRLVRDNRPRLIKELRNLFHDDPADRRAFVGAVSAIGHEARALLPEVRRCLDAPELRWNALGALRAIGPAAKETIPDLIRLTNVDDSSLQEAAIVALCRIGRGHPHGVQRLREWCATQSDYILDDIEPADLGGAKITPILIKALHQGNEYRRDNLMKLLEATDAAAARKLAR